VLKGDLVIFSGGRGTETLTRSFLEQSAGKVKIIVNGYDDGLSTGRIRKLFPGMLGPSDFRKNTARLLQFRSKEKLGIASFLEYRMNAQEVFEIYQGRWPRAINLILDSCPRRYADYVTQATESVLHHLLEVKQTEIDQIDDSALGNLVLASEFLETQNFNQALRRFLSIFELENEIFNVSQGENLTLVGLDTQGKFYASESAIVSSPAKRMKSIFLIHSSEVDELQPRIELLSTDQREEYLRTVEKFPDPNPAVLTLLENCSALIYGPGTLFSSLLPSFKTKGISQTIAKRENTRKIWISNIRQDYDTSSFAVSDLFDSTLDTLRQHHNDDTRKFITHSLVQSYSGNPADIQESDYNKIINPLVLNMRTREGTQHDLQKIGSIISFLLQDTHESIPNLRSLTILVPVKNEVSRVSEVVQNLVTLDFLENGFLHSILVVDSNSNDGTKEICEKMKEQFGISYLRLPKDSGFGYAITEGLRFVNSELVAIFPSDGEYHSKNLVQMLSILPPKDHTTRIQIVLGSRASFSNKERVANITATYDTSITRKFMSHFGGVILSIVCGLRFNKWVSDPVTGLRLADSNTLKQMNLQSKGFEILLEMLAKAGNLGYTVVEIPAEYKPRAYTNGKKLTISHALRVLFASICRRW
jgi:2-phospho-L-lactate transferase/gluconeogenesis factor (CofD/UPF0052 family)